MDILSLQSYQLCCTRFNDATYQEYRQYVHKHNINVYGTSHTITKHIPIDKFIAVIELNIEKGREDTGITGFALICNKARYRANHIYSNKSYNRYSYGIIYRVSREQIQRTILTFTYNSHEHSITGEHLLNLLIKHLLRGSAHSKRGRGITQFPIKKMIDIERDLSLPEWDDTLNIVRIVHAFIYAIVKEINVIPLEIVEHEHERAEALETSEEVREVQCEPA